MIKVQRYTKGTEKLLREVFYSSIHQVCIKDYSQEQIAAWAQVNDNIDLWAKRIEGINPFVAIVDNKVVAYADIQSNGFIDHFFVHSEYQSKGVGSALMKNLLSHGAGCSKIYSYVSITAKDFFEKFKFKVVKEQCVEINGCELINFVMELVKNRCDE